MAAPCPCLGFSRMYFGWKIAQPWDITETALLIGAGIRREFLLCSLQCLALLGAHREQVPIQNPWEVGEIEKR